MEFLLHRKKFSFNAHHKSNSRVCNCHTAPPTNIRDINKSHLSKGPDMSGTPPTYNSSRFGIFTRPGMLYGMVQPVLGVLMMRNVLYCITDVPGSKTGKSCSIQVLTTTLSHRNNFSYGEGCPDLCTCQCLFLRPVPKKEAVSFVIYSFCYSS